MSVPALKRTSSQEEIQHVKQTDLTPKHNEGTYLIPATAQALWGVVEGGYAWLRGDYSGPQNAMKDFFADTEKSAGQKIDHLLSMWSSLGLKGDGLYTFIEELVFATEGTVLKDEFCPIFVECSTFKELPEFVTALQNPQTTEGAAMLASLKEALRIDPAYLSEQTEKVMKSDLPIEQKAVYLMLLLNDRGVTDEQARGCFAVIPEGQRGYFGEDEVELEAVTKVELSRIVRAKIDPLAVLEVMKKFQAQGFGKVVSKLHEDILPRDFHQPLLNLQVAVKEEKEKTKLQTEEMDLAMSVAPGTTVEYRLFSILGTEFNHFTGCKDSKPCGDVATEALSRMIAELKKQRAAELEEKE